MLLGSLSVIFNIIIKFHRQYTHYLLVQILDIENAEVKLKLAVRNDRLFDPRDECDEWKEK